MDSDSTEEQKIKKLIGFSKLEIVVILLLLALIITVPIILSYFNSSLGFNSSGEVGDTIGGITAPFVNLLAAYLVFKSFTAQIKANSQQRDDHNEQMKQLEKEHSFNYISNLFNLIKNDYYENNRIKGKSNMRYIFERMISIEKPKEYQGYLWVYKEEINYDRIKSEINNRVRDPIQTLKSQLMNIQTLSIEIRNSHLDIGIKSFYKIEIEKILFDMDLWILLNPAFTKRMEDHSIFGGFLSNSSGYSHSKLYAETISKMGYNVRTQLDG